MTACTACGEGQFSAGSVVRNGVFVPATRCADLRPGNASGPLLAGRAAPGEEAFAVLGGLHFQGSLRLLPFGLGNRTAAERWGREPRFCVRESLGLGGAGSLHQREMR